MKLPKTTIINKVLKGSPNQKYKKRAEVEFDGFVEILRSKGINIIVAEDIATSNTPDSIFPNNWVSFHDDGSVILYPMFAENRRRERRMDIIDQLNKDFKIVLVDHFTKWEQEGKFLEGTGSMVLDHVNRLAYAAISDRTHEDVLHDFCDKRNYKAVAFHAYQTVGQERLPIYHTNVMMCVGEAFAVICLAAIDDQSERNLVVKSLEESNKEIIEIDENQNNHFAGNILQVVNSNGQRYIVMSDSAFESLQSGQLERFEDHGDIIHSNLNTIEKLGGGSARCMMAEVFLPRK